MYDSNGATGPGTNQTGQPLETDMDLDLDVDANIEISLAGGRIHFGIEEICISGMLCLVLRAPALIVTF